MSKTAAGAAKASSSPHGCFFHPSRRESGFRRRRDDRDFPLILALVFLALSPAGLFSSDPPPVREALERTAASSAPSREKVDALVELSRGSWQTNLADAERYAEEARKISVSLAYEKGKGDSLNSLGVVRLLQGKADAALTFLEQATRVRLAAGDDKGAGRSTANLGHALRALGRYDEALKAYEKAFGMAEKSGDREGLATARDGTGNVHSEQGRWAQAIEAFEESMQWAAKAGDEQSRLTTLNNIANCQQNRGANEAALKGYLEAAKGFERLGLATYESQAYGNIASILIGQNLLDQARTYLDRALAIQRKSGQKGGEASTLINLGVLFEQMNDRTRAEEAYRRSGEIYREVADPAGEALALHNLGLVLGEKKQLGKAISALEASLRLRLRIGDARGAAYSRVALGAALTASDRAPEALPILRQGLREATALGAKEIEAEAHRNLAGALKATGNLAEAIQSLETSGKLREELSNEGSQEKIAEMQTRFETERKEKEIQLLQRDRQIQTLRSNREAAIRRALIGIVALTAGLAAAIASRYRIKKHSEQVLSEKNQQLEEANRQIELERDKAEELLLNILPAPIAKRLKEKPATIADRFSEATILFADIVGFTRLSQELGAEALVRMLGEIFTRFDALTEKHGLEKIKTIGDCYMVVGGIPDRNDEHCACVARMALDMLREIDDFNARSGRGLALRIGINTGVVVAGVIGRKKFIYDLWGDAVNVASRMESQGEPSRIQVTESVFGRLASSFELEPRGEITVKGKGPMKTYFLVRELCEPIRARSLR